MRALGLLLILPWFCGLAPAGAKARSAEHPLQVLRVAIATDHAPFSVADESSPLRGIRPEMWDAWSRSTGVPVRFIVVPWVKTIDAVKAGLADVADPVSFRADRLGTIELSAPYIHNPIQAYFNPRFGRFDEVEDLRPFAVGVIGQGGCGNWLRNQGVINQRNYESPEALIRGARNHEVEVFCLGRHAATLYLAREGMLFGEFRSRPLYEQPIHWAVAAGNTALRDFIQAGFDRIPLAERLEIEQRWTGPAPDPGVLTGVVHKLGWIAGVVVVVVGILAAWNWMLRRRIGAAVKETRSYAARFENLIENLPGMVTRAYQSDGGRFEVLYASRRDGEFVEKLRPLNPHQFAELKATGKTKGRIKVFQADGRTAWHDRWITQVAQRDGGIEYDTLVLDVTSEVEAKEALAVQHKERLRLQGQIQEASRMESLGKLAGGVAHDFNNLLGGILGFAAMIGEDLGTGHPSHRFVDRIVTACSRGKNLVDQILAFARQKKGVPGRFSLHALVTESRPLLDIAIPSSITIQVAAPPSAVEIFADRGQIAQILMNLCFNARDALEGRTGSIVIGIGSVPPGEPKLDLAEADGGDGGKPSLVVTGADGWSWLVVGTCVDDRPRAVLSIRDNGAGMSPSLMSRVFDPFFTTKGTGGGTGLGLSVVHGNVVANGGGILLRSCEGVGTEFQVFLPMAEGQAKVPAMAAEPVSTPVRAGGRVLVVDDDDDFGAMIAMVMERWGWTVTLHRDPRDALQAFSERPDDWTLVISDQVMPHLRGLELVARMKNIRPDLPCILCSGYDATLDVDEASAQGIDRVLQKPVDPKTLGAAITGLLT